MAADWLLRLPLDSKIILHAATSHLQGEFVPADLLDVSSQCFNWSVTGSVAPDRHSSVQHCPHGTNGYQSSQS